MTEPVDDRIMWVDIETTGLNPKKDAILEIGMLCTNNDGSKEFGHVNLLIHDRDDFYETAIQRGHAHPIVGPMHEKSGLWLDLQKAVDIRPWPGAKMAYTRLAAIQKIQNWFEDLEIEPGTVVLASNSPSGVDRPFLQEKMPSVHELFHYRTIDVSSIKEACRRLNPRVFDSFTKPDGGHRVMDDISACIAEWQFYIDEFMYVTYEGVL